MDRQQLMLANANERLVELEEKLMIDCRATIMYQANLIVDSLLIARARADKDTILKPMKPDKPLRPDILTPLDSADVQPLFKE